MKEAGYDHWIQPNTGASNSSGFTGLPGGCRPGGGSFSDINNIGFLSSSARSSPSFRWCAANTSYVSAAEFDDGSCDYVSCLDECGVINGDNSSCIDCAGVVNGTSEDLGCGCGNPAAQEGYDCDGNVLPQIGDQYAGGIVFQINEDGTGLVADLQDLEVDNWWNAMDAAASSTSQGYDDWYLYNWPAVMTEGDLSKWLAYSLRWRVHRAH